MVKPSKSYAFSRNEKWDLGVVKDLSQTLPKTHNDYNILKYVDKMADRDGTIKVKYYYPKDCKFGRVYAHGPSYQSCTKDTRARCASAFHEDDEVFYNKSF